ncbi:cytochrome-c peroxidase [Lysobacter pythonis]|uniref:Cytochrome-c peroxidase n=1 Tax=Solilutibacter pythonis TaxID=2483112 RepID=A0A3M2I338_9GAMM|nr:cytochrome-c peroxidase [Lysobacter pythonis]RMH94745.1 cytochrome-c peroxidase [Lysobacter pythonis]
MSISVLRPAILASALALAACGQSANNPPSAAETARAPASASSEPAVAKGPEAAPELLTRARALFQPIPDKAPDPAGNPVTADKIALGKMLYFDGRLSSSGVISCNSCHNLGMGGIDGVPTSIGHGFDKGPRNAPTVYNAVFNVAQFWDGRAADLKAQAQGPVQAAVEMNSKPDVVEAVLTSMPGYVNAFKAAFPGEAKPVNFDNMAKAIEAFETTLTTPGAAFDEFLKGDTRVLSAEQQAGLKLFMDKGCGNCHNGVNLGGQAYFPFGVMKKPSDEVRPSGDRGRFAVTQTASDEYVFRAAPLRNIAATAPYFHSGTVWNLREAVKIMGDSQLGASLSDEEANNIYLFLQSLTGKMPKVDYPQLPERSDNTPPPPGY